MTVTDSLTVESLQNVRARHPFLRSTPAKACSIAMAGGRRDMTGIADRLVDSGQWTEMRVISTHIDNQPCCG